jgi:hypothetical protein
MTAEQAGPVRVDPHSVLARIADWHARGRQRPVGAVAAPGRRPTLFVANEVLIDARDRDLVERLTREHGAEAIRPRPLPPSPIDRVRDVSIDAMPVAARVRFPPEFALPDAAARVAGAMRGPVRETTITSAQAASVAALVLEHAAAGHPIALNLFGVPAALPLASAQEGGGSNPFTWPVFAGHTRVVEAWQLIESYRALRSGSGPVWIAILDGGFWLDAAGAPGVPAGQTASDFGGGVLQINLMDESARAGGTNPNKCSGGSDCPWHGNGVASAAAARVGNSVGAAGTGGTVAQPAFFRSDLSVDQILRCLQFCTAWGLDVVNMSFSIEPFLGFPFNFQPWDETFQFAADHGVIVIASAGNDGERLPDNDYRPATRTPGVITVGALAPDNSAAGYSNYGPSVSIWAPGLVPVAPDPDNPNGSDGSGTSIAAPFVAGVVAMLRFVNDALGSAPVRDLLVNTGWPGAGHVSRGIDAAAAVFAAMGNQLPADREPNDSSAAAAELWPVGPDGSLAPGAGGLTTRSHAGDADWWKFTVAHFSRVRVSAEWYQPLGNFGIDFFADDPDSRAPGEIDKRTSITNGTVFLNGLLAPGTYRLRVTGSGATAYRLTVKLTLAPLRGDRFEQNDSFARAARFVFRWPTGPISPYLIPTYGPGYYDATLHQGLDFSGGTIVANPDFFHFDVPVSSVFAIPTIRIADTDAPIDVALYDADEALLQSWPGVRRVVIEPTQGSRYLRISGASPTRYSLDVDLRVDRDAVPQNWEEIGLSPLPDWWGDPLLRVRDRVRHFVVTVGDDVVSRAPVVFQMPGEAFGVEVLDLAGRVVGHGERVGRGRVQVAAEGLAAGRYVVRVTRSGDVAAGAAKLRLGPGRIG